NYSAYQARLAAQQAEAQRAPAAKAPKVKSSPDKAKVKGKAPRAPRRRKPEVIERDIGEVEAEIDGLQSAIDTEQQNADWQRLAELTSQQGALAARLEELMHEWEESMKAAEEGRR
ncbi:MAG: hypothetical protein ETSY2_32155, partial [Candidatus Entotheonella gemina]